MAKIRFRPVVLGPLEHPDVVFPLFESENGDVDLYLFEAAVPVRAPLETATPADLPQQIRQHDPVILPVQVVEDDESDDAFGHMMRACSAIEHGALVPGAR